MRHLTRLLCPLFFLLTLTVTSLPAPGHAQGNPSGASAPLGGILQGWYDTGDAPPGDGAVEGFLFWNKGVSGIEAVFRISPGLSQVYAGPQLNVDTGHGGRFHAAMFGGIQDFGSSLYPRWAMELGLYTAPVEVYGRLEHDFDAAGAGAWYTVEVLHPLKVVSLGARARRFAGWGPLVEVDGEVGGLPFEVWMHWAPNGPERLETFTPLHFQFGAGLFF